MKNSESGSDSDESTWTPYRDRPEWNDILPLPQDDGNQAIVQICYSEKFQDVYDYLRAVMNQNERSERALALTHDAITLNAANYTVWQYRREILKSLDSNLEEELEYTQKMIKENHKNYQVWHHRQVLVEWLNDPSKELEMTAQVLDIDAKNYHAWQHRQWVIRTFGLWDNEQNYVDYLLEEDIRNNSAWNHRYFIMSNTSRLSGDSLRKEIDFTKSCIKKVVQNESSWNYLRGITSTHSLSEFPDIQQFCDELYEKSVRSPYLLAFIVDLCDDKLEKGCENKEQVLTRALKLCDELANEHDKIRTEYWKYQARTLAHKYTDRNTGSGETPA